MRPARGGHNSIRVESADGNVYEATLLASDPSAGLALIKVEGGHFAPLALADSVRPGAVTVAAFSKPSVFGPEVQMLRGELAGQPAQPGQPATLGLRVGTHPRSAGSPLVNDKGQVVAVLTANRDDPLSHLPVAGVDVVRKFLAGKISTPGDGGGGGAVHVRGFGDAGGMRAGREGSVSFGDAGRGPRPAELGRGLGLAPTVPAEGIMPAWKETPSRVFWWSSRRRSP